MLILDYCGAFVAFVSKEWFRLQAFWNGKGSRVCHQCTASKEDYMCLPNTLESKGRRSTDDFVKQACQRGEKSSLVSITFVTRGPEAH